VEFNVGFLREAGSYDNSASEQGKGDMPRATILSSRENPPAGLVVGLGIAALNADAAREVFNAAKEERLAAGEPAP